VKIKSSLSLEVYIKGLFLDN